MFQYFGRGPGQFEGEIAQKNAEQAVHERLQMGETFQAQRLAEVPMPSPLKLVLPSIVIGQCSRAIGQYWDPSQSSRVEIEPGPCPS